MFFLASAAHAYAYPLTAISS